MCVQTGKLHHTTTVPSLKNYGNPKKLECSYKLTCAFFANVLKGEMEVARGWGRRRKKLLDDLKDRRGYSHLKEKALDRTMWRHRSGGGFGPVIRQITEWMNVCHMCDMTVPYTCRVKGYCTWLPPSLTKSMSLTLHHVLPLLLCWHPQQHFTIFSDILPLILITIMTGKWPKRKKDCKTNLQALQHWFREWNDST